MPPSEFYALLPGRKKPIIVCHEDPASCGRCLLTVAAFLAAEINWEMATALDRPVSAYQAEFVPVGCTHDQALELRRLTVQACFVRQCDRFLMPFSSAASVFVVADEAVITSEAHG